MASVVKHPFIESFNYRSGEDPPVSNGSRRFASGDYCVSVELESCP